MLKKLNCQYIINNLKTMSILFFKSIMRFERKWDLAIKRRKVGLENNIRQIYQIFMAIVSCCRDRIYMYYAKIDNVYPKHQPQYCISIYFKRKIIGW